MTHTQPTYCTMHPNMCQIKEPKNNPKIKNCVGLNSSKQWKLLRNIWGMPFRILLSSFQKETLSLFLSLPNAVQPQNPFRKCCPTTVHSLKAHDVSPISTRIRIFIHSTQPPSVCLQAGGLSYVKGAPGAAHCSPLPAGAAGGRSRETFICPSLPLGKVLPTSREQK